MDPKEPCFGSILTLWFSPLSFGIGRYVGFCRLQIHKNCIFRVENVLMPKVSHGFNVLISSRNMHIFIFHNDIHGQVKASWDFKPWKSQNFHFFTFLSSGKLWCQRYPMVFMLKMCSKAPKDLLKPKKTVGKCWHLSKIHFEKSIYVVFAISL